jgi:hypothetical protein
MTSLLCRFFAAFTVLFCIANIALSTISAAQQSGPPQPPSQRDDPATSGAGPTSGAPGQYNYDPPKEGSTTYDARGVTTTQQSSDNSKSNRAPRDPGNESMSATPPK